MNNTKKVAKPSSLCIFCKTNEGTTVHKRFFNAEGKLIERKKCSPCNIERVKARPKKQRYSGLEIETLRPKAKPGAIDWWALSKQSVEALSSRPFYTR